MSTLALADRTEPLTVTPDQLELIKRTIAQGATPDELRLYLFDCHRQGVHPLDKLVHFTKRSGKYTPITSIDFMRIRAAETNEYAGSDDAVLFGGGGITPPAAATVTVYRLVQGQRCAFTATARWSEYKPETNDFMWRKMPCTMLGKCAEALALRKGFPRQLAGLYAREELDQAELEPAPPSRILASAPEAPEAPEVREAPESWLVIKVEDARTGGACGRLVFDRPLEGQVAVLTFSKEVMAVATECCQHRLPVRVETKRSTAGNLRVERLTPFDEPF